MTTYDDDRVVTLLREVELPAAPSDRLAQVGRRARARESRLMTGLAGALAVVLVGGVFGVASLRDDGGQQALTVAGAAQTTAAAGSARVTIQLDLAGLQAALPAGAATTMPKDPRMSGVVDFVHQRFVLRGNLTGVPTEQRGIGSERWDRTGSGAWEHHRETTAGNDFEQLDPSRLLSKLTSAGRTLSTSVEGDRTVFRLRVPSTVLFDGGGSAQPVDVRVEADDVGRVRLLSTTQAEPGAGSITFTMTFDDFGVAVDVRPPPADQVVEAPKAGVTGSQGEVSITGTAVPMTPEQACQGVATLENQGASMTGEQKQAFDRMLAELRKQCAKK